MRNVPKPGLLLHCFLAGFASFAACVLIVEPLGAADAPPTFNEGPWPYHPPRRPAVPVVQNGSRVANPIDAFVVHTLEEHGLQLNDAADKLTLLRRVTFDLTGLPPTVDEQDAFLADSSSDAYARVVSRLLDSPRYGERWAQHWLDVVRFAESDGFKEDAPRPNAHKYRDYVIRAFNADLPYDRFVAQQLAGDELEPANPEALIATGLNRLYPDEYNAANVRQRRQEIHDDLTDATSLTFLGLTVGCAQCHDHKFDPISQVDYFRLQAFFAPLLPRDDVQLGTPEEKQKFAAQQAEWEQATATLRAEMESILAPRRAAVMEDALLKFEPDIRDAMATAPEARTAMQQQLCTQVMKFVSPKLREAPEKELKGEAKERYEALKKQLAEFKHLKPASLPTAMAVSDASAVAPPTHRLAVGNYRAPLEEVQPGFPKFLGDSEPKLASLGDASTTGRRAALARWLTRPDHPLVSRVMVNRLWQHHFGRGIVATPNDFGAMGAAPSHPQLLDWLAVELVESGWSLKTIHRLMVTSATYQQSSRIEFDSAAHSKALEADPENRWLWHAQRHRLEGEALRDAMLLVAGQLNTRMFGPSSHPELPAGIDAKSAWPADKRADDRDRRSIYIFAKRNLRFPLLEMFDSPDMHNSCAQRPTTITAPQALALLNGEFSLAMARHWSGRLLSAHGADTGALLKTAFREAFTQPASDEQLQAAGAFLVQQASALATTATADPDAMPTSVPEGYEPAQAAAVVDFCHALLNANEFLYVD